MKKTTTLKRKGSSCTCPYCGNESVIDLVAACEHVEGMEKLTDESGTITGYKFIFMERPEKEINDWDKAKNTRGY